MWVGWWVGGECHLNILENFWPLGFLYATHAHTSCCCEGWEGACTEFKSLTREVPPPFLSSSFFKKSCRSDIARIKAYSVSDVIFLFSPSVSYALLIIVECLIQLFAFRMESEGQINSSSQSKNKTASFPSTSGVIEFPNLCF